jgi:hypothetical protein
MLRLNQELRPGETLMVLQRHYHPQLPAHRQPPPQQQPRSRQPSASGRAQSRPPRTAALVAGALRPLLQQRAECRCRRLQAVRCASWPAPVLHPTQTACWLCVLRRLQSVHARHG